MDNLVGCRVRYKKYIPPFEAREGVVVGQYKDLYKGGSASDGGVHIKPDDGSPNVVRYIPKPHRNEIDNIELI